MEPSNKNEYLDKFAKNQKITGYGIDVTMHMPCAFCAEPDFLVFRVIDSETAMEKGAVCKQCHRGVKALMDKSHGGIGFEIVQTEGPDGPDWLKPTMRRV